MDKEFNFRKYGIDFSFTFVSTDYKVLDVANKTTQSSSNRISKVSGQMMTEIHTHHEVILTLGKLGEESEKQVVLSITPVDGVFSAIVGNVVSLITVEGKYTKDSSSHKLLVVNRTNDLLGFVTETLRYAFNSEKTGYNLLEFPKGFSIKNFPLSAWLFIIPLIFLWGIGFIILLLGMAFGNQKHEVLANILYRECIESVKRNEL